MSSCSQTILPRIFLTFLCQTSAITFGAHATFQKLRASKNVEIIWRMRLVHEILKQSHSDFVLVTIVSKSLLSGFTWTKALWVKWFLCVQWQCCPEVSAWRARRSCSWPEIWRILDQLWSSGFRHTVKLYVCEWEPWILMHQKHCAESTSWSCSDPCRSECQIIEKYNSGLHYSCVRCCRCLSRNLLSTKGQGKHNSSFDASGMEKNWCWLPSCGSSIAAKHHQIWPLSA